MSKKNAADDVELSDKDIEDLNLLDAIGQPIDHTLLYVWREVLSNIEKIREERVSPVIANKIVSSWPKLAYQDVPAYHELYHGYLTEYRDTLDEVIKEFPGCFKHTAPVGEEGSDAIENRAAYLELLFRWHSLNISFEHEWDAAADDSHVSIAAIADAAAFTIGPSGLTQHLAQPQVAFQWTDEDQQELQARLLEAEEQL